MPCRRVPYIRRDPKVRLGKLLYLPTASCAVCLSASLNHNAKAVCQLGVRQIALRTWESRQVAVSGNLVEESHFPVARQLEVQLFADRPATGGGLDGVPERLAGHRRSLLHLWLAREDGQSLRSPETLRRRSLAEQVRSPADDGVVELDTAGLGRPSADRTELAQWRTSLPEPVIPPTDNGTIGPHAACVEVPGADASKSA